MCLARPLAAIVIADGPSRLGGPRSPALSKVDGVPRIERCLRQLVRLGIRRVVVVVGCDLGEVSRIASRVSSELPLSLITLRNPHWSARGTMASLAHVHAWDEDPVLLVDGTTDCTDFDIERVLLGQTDMTLGACRLRNGRRDVRVAVFRGRAFRWVVGAARTEMRTAGGFGPWWRLMNSTRGGLSLTMMDIEPSGWERYEATAAAVDGIDQAQMV